MAPSSSFLTPKPITQPPWQDHAPSFMAQRRAARVNLQWGLRTFHTWDRGYRGDYGGNHWLQSKICSLVWGSSISLFAPKSFCDRFVTPPNPECLFPPSQKNNDSHIDSWSHPCWLNIPRSQFKNLPIQAGKLGNPVPRWGLMRVDDYFLFPLVASRSQGVKGKWGRPGILGPVPQAVVQKGHRSAI